MAIAAGFADRKDHQHRLGDQSPGHESQNLTGRGVKPLRIIDNAQQRPPHRRFGQQAEHGEGHEEAIGNLARGEPERDPKRVLLRLGETPDVGEHRCAELMQSREGQFHLGLRAHNPHDGKANSPIRAMVEQRCLPDSGFAAHHDRGALAGLNRLQQPGQLVTL